MKGKRGLAFLVLLLCVVGHSIGLKEKDVGAGALPEAGYLLRQGRFVREILPLVGAIPAAAFYNYADYQANNGLAVPDHSLIFLYRDMESGELSLVIIHDAPGDETDGSASFLFSGLPLGTRVALMDDPDGDRFSLDPPEGEAHWYWTAAHTDGLILDGLGETFEITIKPNFLWGITAWDVLTGTGVEDPHRPNSIPLPSLTEPLTISGRNSPPRAYFSFSPLMPYLHEPVTFDARGSSDLDGRIISYDWDFDGDGIFERRTEVPVTVHSFDETSPHLVTLRVRDDLGAVGVFSREIEIQETLVHVRREISGLLPDHEILPGGAFRVTVRIEAYGSILGLGLDEDPPEGWAVRPIDNAGAQFKPLSVQWAFIEGIYPGEKKRITYELRVPEEAEPGSFTLRGRVITTLPPGELPVQGDSEVKVVRFLSIKVAISKIDVETGELNPSLPNIISFQQIQFAVALWLEDRPVPGTNGKRIDLRTMLELITYWLTDTPVDQPLH